MQVYFQSEVKKINVKTRFSQLNQWLGQDGCGRGLRKNFTIRKIVKFLQNSRET